MKYGMFAFLEEKTALTNRERDPNILRKKSRQVTRTQTSEVVARSGRRRSDPSSARRQPPQTVIATAQGTVGSRNDPLLTAQVLSA